MIELIRGKWYKEKDKRYCTHIRYICFKEWDKQYPHCPLHQGLIVNNRYSPDYNGGGIYNSQYGKNLIPCTDKDLEIIKSYLPDEPETFKFLL